MSVFFAPVVRSRARSASPSFRSYDSGFENFIDRAFFSPATPGFKVEQDDKAWTLSLDLPGVAREELSISIEGAVVRIETKTEAKRQFKAAYELPQEIDVANTATGAKLENGVLTLTLAKQVPVSNVRTIEVK